mgnify:CR=1 FL=1
MFMTLYAVLYTIFNIWCPLKSKSFLAAFSIQLDIFMMMGAETVLQFFVPKNHRYIVIPWELLPPWLLIL